jgi:hypothetical protein
MSILSLISFVLGGMLQILSLTSHDLTYKSNMQVLAIICYVLTIIFYSIWLITTINKIKSEQVKLDGKVIRLQKLIEQNQIEQLKKDH